MSGDFPRRDRAILVVADIENRALRGELITREVVADSLTRYSTSGVDLSLLVDLVHEELRRRGYEVGPLPSRKPTGCLGPVLILLLVLVI